ncbi:hypothetical protein [Ferrovibrio sp.]|uniref:hypothetical protein n=1 Tax=Ferrovibrio sp. TaxID=1917215 RepID=UPI00311E6BE6
MRILAWLAFLILLPALSAPAYTQNDNRQNDGRQNDGRHPRQIDGIPQDRQDTALQGKDAREAMQKAGLLAVISSPYCSKPTLRYSTVPLAGPAGIDRPAQQAEIWYFQCPEIAPVLVHYTQADDGTVGNIHVHEFYTFMRDLPLSLLATRRNPAVNAKNFPKRSALHEASCFGILSEDVLERVMAKVPRMATADADREQRQMCLRARACNTIEPDLDILQDISLGSDADRDSRNALQGFVTWCNAREARILLAEEPEFAYGLMHLLPNVPQMTDQDEAAFKRDRRK